MNRDNRPDVAAQRPHGQHEVSTEVRSWLQQPLRREWLDAVLPPSHRLRFRPDDRRRPWVLKPGDGADSRPRAFETCDDALAHATAALGWTAQDLEARFLAYYRHVHAYVASRPDRNAWAHGPDPIHDVYLADFKLDRRGPCAASIVDATSGQCIDRVSLEPGTGLGLAAADMLVDGLDPDDIVLRGLYYDPVSATLTFDEHEALAGRFIAQGQDVVEIETERLSRLELEPATPAVPDILKAVRRGEAIIERIGTALVHAGRSGPHERARLFVDAADLVRLAYGLAEWQAPVESIDRARKKDKA